MLGWDYLDLEVLVILSVCLIVRLLLFLMEYRPEFTLFCCFFPFCVEDTDTEKIDIFDEFIDHGSAARVREKVIGAIYGGT